MFQQHSACLLHHQQSVFLRQRDSSNGLTSLSWTQPDRSIRLPLFDNCHKASEAQRSLSSQRELCLLCLVYHHRRHRPNVDRKSEFLHSNHRDVIVTSSIFSSSSQHFAAPQNFRSRIYHRAVDRYVFLTKFSNASSSCRVACRHCLR